MKKKYVIVLAVLTIVLNVNFTFSQSALNNLVYRSTKTPLRYYLDSCVTGDDDFICTKVDCDSIRGLFYYKQKKVVCFKELNQFKNLEFLYIGKNSYRSMIISNELDQIDYIKFLSFMHTYQKVKFQENIQAIDSLQYLYLPDKARKDIPSFVYRSSELLYLCATIKKYSSINYDSLGMLKKLEELNLVFEKKIKNVPNQISSMTNLKILSISTTQDAELDSNILNLKNLEEFWINIRLDGKSLELLTQLPKLKKLYVDSVDRDVLNNPYLLRKIDEIYVTNNGLITKVN